MHPVSDLRSLLSLEQVKPDAYLGAGPVLGWGRIYGGQVIAQALRAAGLTVDERLRPQSLHAYFVRAGDEHLPVLYEVERVRDSGSFATRQVVAYQAQGAGTSTGADTAAMSIVGSGRWKLAMRFRTAPRAW